ncbi:hypothetical protein PG1C_05615 [Rugosibacter aromaticivorans]|uniref:Uncharacterized protein n=1 Tax=Rugosibacter aromaticivorans TaxID=1565605 RepID=A0A0C5J8N7_9PROT|nr:hypothetical protein PG1C_05615 [Rugosibacter aromaticivorans]
MFHHLAGQVVERTIRDMARLFNRVTNVMRPYLEAVASLRAWSRRFMPAIEPGQGAQLWQQPAA